jgi:hypothetical protein
MQKVYLRVPVSLQRRIGDRCGASGMPIFRLFEEAIDLAFTRRRRFWQVSAPSLPRRTSGRRLGANLVPIGTQVSFAHYRRLKSLSRRPKRFISDVLTAALLFYFNRGPRSPAVTRAAFELLVYPSFPAQSVILPRDPGDDCPRLDAILPGTSVLIDAWVLLCGTSTAKRDSVCSYLSEQSWRLLQRCRTGELVGMISMLEIVAFQRLLAKFWHRARNKAKSGKETPGFTKEEEMARRIYAVSHSGLHIIPLLPEHVHATVTEMLDEEFDAAISVACAKSYLRRPFVIATLGWNYDDWKSQFPVFKASDAGTSPPIVTQAPDASSVPGPVYIKPSIESEYARIMAENGRSIPAKIPVEPTASAHAGRKEHSNPKGADPAPIHSQLWAPYVPNRF